VLAANPATLPLTARFKKFFAQRTLAESTQLIKYKVKFSKREDRSQTFPKVTNTTPMQKKYFNMIGIRNPMSLEKFIW